MSSYDFNFIIDEIGASFTPFHVRPDRATFEVPLFAHTLYLGNTYITEKQLSDLLKLLENNPGLIEGTKITATDDAVTLA
jgi:hypothetical protein